MGRSGSKPRKPEHSRHLPKVGTPAENEFAQHEEREAVLDQMGMRNAWPLAKVVVATLAVVLMIGAILGFTLLVVFR